MKAMLIRDYGDPDVFELGEVTAPKIADDEILVKVHGSSVNPVDAAMRAGMLRSFIRLRLPVVLGVDVAGEVIERGSNAKRFAIGDRVFAFTGLARPGGYGSLVALPEIYFARVPENLTWAEAGTVPGVGATAYEAFTVHSRVQDGTRVFINGGSGGVGTYAIQIAKALGAHVTVTASTTKIPIVEQLGADRVIDYTRGNAFSDGRASFDVILNAVRGTPLGPMRRLLRENGRLITLTGIPPQILWMRLRNAITSRKTIVMFVQTSGAILEGLAGLMEKGRVRPVLERTYRWNELAEAHRRIESGRVTGKIAVVP